MRITKERYLLLAAGLACFMLMQSCAKREKQAKASFEFVQADKYFVPPADETVAILLYPVGDINDCNVCPVEALFGDKKESERITGKKFKPWTLVKGREWLEKIMYGYKIALKEAEEKNFERRGIMGKIVFITRNKGYIRGINMNFDENVAYDNYMESALLRDYFKELGFVPIRPHQADKYFVPPKDETVAILLYSDNQGFYVRPPVALFGDKKQAERILYGNKKLVEKLVYGDRSLVERLERFVLGDNLEPKKIFEGRVWLEKIMDAYEIALKEAKENKKEKIYYRKGIIVFVTPNEVYTRGIDVSEDTIYDDVTESNLLKAYIDELGLTKELLAGEPNKASHD